jgi:hypothetical protein
MTTGTGTGVGPLLSITFSMPHTSYSDCTVNMDELIVRSGTGVGSTTNASVFYVYVAPSTTPSATTLYNGTYVCGLN